VVGVFLRVFECEVEVVESEDGFVECEIDVVMVVGDEV